MSDCDSVIFFKRLRLFFVMVLAVLHAPGMLGLAQAGTDVCSEIRLNGSSVWFPVSMRETGADRLAGVFPDLARDILKSLDVPLREGPDLPWKRVFVLLENGQIDVLAGAYKTAERLEKYGVSLPVMQEEVGIFVRKSLGRRPQSLDELIGLRGVAPFGASFGEEFETFAQEHLAIDRQPFDDFGTYMRLLMDDKADYLVLARQDGDMLITETGAEDLVEALPWPAAVNTLHFLFSRATPCIGLLEAFDAELQRRIGSGTLQDLIKTYDPSKGDG